MAQKRVFSNFSMTGINFVRHIEVLLVIILSTLLNIYCVVCLATSLNNMTSNEAILSLHFLSN